MATWGDLNDKVKIPVDIYHNDEYLTILAPVAGVEIEDIDLNVVEDKLVISGKRVMIEEVQKEQYLNKECFWGDFVREIILPDKIDLESINARFKKNMLIIKIAKIKNSEDDMQNKQTIKISKE